ncbi:TIGR04076 family protein [Maribacter sp. 2307UL18-2]|uniref:TIGR04076 family protein n=1 Tax=Maribacter sp. 2307UL18-2 TaxID=3386274 RepID=UPI0039BC9AB0
MEKKKELRDDQFELYDLTVVVEKIDGNCTCVMKVGDAFHLKGGKLSMANNIDFCLYALQSTIPLLPTKQRKNHPADWMETDARVVCPDPECKLVMRIDRGGLRVLDHDDVSPVKWDGSEK